jgi:hemerythrin
MKEGKSEYIIADTLQKLIEYYRTHFVYEEQLMRSNDYPDYLKHKLLHHDFSKKVLEFQRKIIKGQSILVFELIDFLMEWLTKHILVVENNIASF